MLYIEITFLFEKERLHAKTLRNAKTQKEKTQKRSKGAEGERDDPKNRHKQQGYKKQKHYLIVLPVIIDQRTCSVST